MRCGRIGRCSHFPRVFKRTSQRDGNAGVCKIRYKRSAYRHGSGRKALLRGVRERAAERANIAARNAREAADALAATANQRATDVADALAESEERNRAAAALHAEQMEAIRAELAAAKQREYSNAEVLLKVIEVCLLKNF